MADPATPTRPRASDRAQLPGDPAESLDPASLADRRRWRRIYLAVALSQAVVIAALAWLSGWAA